MHPYLEHDGPAAFAHRGGAGDWPENTMPAFAHAVSLGYRYLETDVHLSSDGVVVAFHDAELDRVSDGAGRIGDHKWDHLAQIRVGGEEPIPRLDELLASFPEARLNIDAKSDDVVEPLLTLLDRTDSFDRVCLGSFDDARLARIRSTGPKVCTSLGQAGVLRLVLRSLGLAVSVPPADCAQIPTHYRRVPIVTTRLLERSHDLEMPVHVWTIDDESTMDELLDIGVDGIMTDLPAVLRKVLERRGQWT